MIADLLEAHQEAEHDAFATDSLRVFQRRRQVLHCALVERRLGRTQMAERFQFALVGQV